MGDPAGIGPEVAVKAASEPRIRELCEPIIYGDGNGLKQVLEACRLKIGIDTLSDASTLATTQPSRVWVVDCGQDESTADGDGNRQIKAGEISRFTGQLSFNFVERAIADALTDKVAAVVTGPINKEAWNQAGIQFPGHTELFAERTGTSDFCMMMTSPHLSCSLVTCHVGLAEVPAMLSAERILRVIRLTHQSLSSKNGRPPKLAVLGLNPHAGENGLFGESEEERAIIPAINAAKGMGIDVRGPLPPDTAFLPWQLKQTDGHICMYHDQGLIPFKALAFDTGVNVTLGLPMVRTSVDHGTALDIAWQNKADKASMIAAIEMAVRMSAGGANAGVT